MGEQWHYIINDKQAGPISAGELKLMVSTGQLTSQSLVWREGMSEWVAAGTLPGLFVPQNPYAATASVAPMDFGVSSNRPLVYGGFLERFAAAFIDGIITTGLGFVVGLFFGIVMVIGGQQDQSILEVVGNLIGMVIGWLYYAIMESSSKQATLGKMALGMKVTDLNGNRIGFGRATGRYFAKTLSFLLLGIGFLMVLFTEKKQGLHDILAGCVIVKN